jgi:Xaa-Pro aminopeptidase
MTNLHGGIKFEVRPTGERSLESDLRTLPMLDGQPFKLGAPYTADFCAPHTESSQVDMTRLRHRRLRRVQQEMVKRDISGLLLLNPVNIRYTTGLAVMSAWTSVNLARYVFVPASGEPVIFEYGKALFRAAALWSDARIARTWQHRFSQNEVQTRKKQWATEITTLMTQASGLRSERRLGIDVIDFYGFEALQEEGLSVCDADEVMQAARIVKEPEEIELIKQSLVVAEAALYDLEQAIRPGVTENELLGVFYHKMLAMGGEHCSTRLLCSGEKTNPWFYEAGTRCVRPGDLVAIDTDMVGPEGYLCDISRTFICGGRANSYQKEAYKVASDFIKGTFELCRPGMSLREICLNAPEYPDEYKQLCYSCMIHGIGMDDEPPFLPFPHAIRKVGESVIPDEELRPNTVLSIEFYAGKEGYPDGVKLEEQVLITERGPVWLSRYPDCDALS